MPKSLSVAEIRRARARLARGLGRQGEIMKGSLAVRFTRCGRPGCRCATGAKHGPYLYVSVFREGRTRSVYVPRHLEEEVRRWVDNARAVERDVAELTDVNAEWLRRVGKGEEERGGARSAGGARTGPGRESGRVRDGGSGSGGSRGSRRSGG